MGPLLNYGNQFRGGGKGTKATIWTEKPCSLQAGFGRASSPQGLWGASPGLCGTRVQAGHCQAGPTGSTGLRVGLVLTLQGEDRAQRKAAA